MKKLKDTIGVKGCFRLQITKDGKVEGDSGWKTNLVTNLGFNQYLVTALGSGTLGAGKSVTHMAIGTGGAPIAADTALAGEQTVREAVTAASSSGSKTVRFTATFASADSFVTATKNISNIGLFNTVTSAVGTLFAGNTFASSACATNQNVIWRHLLGIVKRKFRGFGGTLYETIPSRAHLWEGVQTMYGITRTVKDIVGSIWRHIELSRNDLALAFARVTSSNATYDIIFA